MAIKQTTYDVVQDIKTKTDALPDSIWTSAADTTPTSTTRECVLVSGGFAVGKSFTISGNGATAINLYSFSGIIHLKQIRIRIGVVTSATTFSNVKYTVYDGTNSVDLTGTVDCSATVAGSEVFKADAVAGATIHLKADEVRIKESSFNRPFVETVLNPKAGVTNYIRLNFTGDANTSIAATACCLWIPLSEGALVEAA